MNKLNGTKKILISVAVFVVLVAALIGLLLILGNSGKQPQEEETTTAFFQTEDQTSEILTSEKPTLSPAMSGGLSISEEEQNIISAFISGVYYLKGSTIQNGAASPIEIAIDGTNLQTSTEIDGIKMGIMLLSNNIYIVNEKENKYMNMKDLTALVGETGNFDVSSVQEIVKSMNMSQFNFTEIDQSDVTVDGQAAVCYTCRSADINVAFYFVNKGLQKIEAVSSDGTTTLEIDIDIFYPYIPSGMLTLIGKQKTTVFGIFGEEYLKQ